MHEVFVEGGLVRKLWSVETDTLKAVKVVSVARSPWQNPYAERIIGTLRRDRLDHVVIFGARHLRRILTAYSHYYNGTRTHLSLDKDAPLGRPVQRHGAILDAVCRKLRKNMNQKITGFHKDEENHWVADLECGHAQHVRHDPPWRDRPWTQTQEGRNSRLGMELDCVRCDELGAAVAESVRALIGKTVQEAYENAGISGLCAEGRWDVTMDSLRALDLKPSIVSALRPKTS